MNYGLNCRIPCHLFACHWIRIASIVLCFVLQRTPTNENNGGTEWRGIQQLLRIMFSDNLICTLVPHLLRCFVSKEIVNISFLDHNDNKKYLNVFSWIPFYSCLPAHNSHTGTLSKQIPLLLGQVNYLVEFIKIHNLPQM